MEVLRWKGNHEILCHSPPFSCSSVTSMSLSGRGGKKTACQTMLFYNVRYSESSQLVSLIRMLEHRIFMPYCCVLCLLKPVNQWNYALQCFLWMWLKYDRVFFGGYEKKNLSHSHVQKPAVETLSPPPSTPAAIMLSNLTNNRSQPPSIPPTRRPWI